MGVNPATQCWGLNRWSGDHLQGHQARANAPLRHGNMEDTNLGRLAGQNSRDGVAQEMVVKLRGTSFNVLLLSYLALKKGLRGCPSQRHSSMHLVITVDMGFQ